MKRLSCLVFGLILLTASVGCSRKTVAPPSVSVHEQNDSIREKIVERIITIHDSVPVFIPVERFVNVLPDSDTSKLETSMAVSTAFIDSNGFLHHSLDNKDQTIYAPVDISVSATDTTHEEYHSQKDADTIYVSVPAQLTGGQKFLIKAGWLSVAAIVALLVYVVIRLWRRR